MRKQAPEGCGEIDAEFGVCAEAFLALGELTGLIRSMMYVLVLDVKLRRGTEMS